MNVKEDELSALYASWDAEKLIAALTAQRTDYSQVAIGLMEAEVGARGLPMPKRCALCASFFFASEAGCQVCAGEIQPARAAGHARRIARRLKVASLSAFICTMIVVTYDAFRLIETVKSMFGLDGTLLSLEFIWWQALLSQVMFLFWRLAIALFFIAFYAHLTKTQEEPL